MDQTPTSPVRPVRSGWRRALSAVLASALIPAAPLVGVAGCGAAPARGPEASAVEAVSPEGVADDAVSTPGQRAARGRRKALRLTMTPERARTCRAWRDEARAAGASAGVDPVLLLAIAWVESGFRTGAVSSAGARGPLQLMPRTSRAFGCTSPSRPACAFPAAARLMRRLLDRFDDQQVYALCAYNAGAGRIASAHRARRLPFNVWYAERVQAAAARLRARGCDG